MTRLMLCSSLQTCSLIHSHTDLVHNHVPTPRGVAMLHRFMYLLYVAYKPAETNVAILFLHVVMQCTCMSLSLYKIDFFSVYSMEKHTSFWHVHNLQETTISKKAKFSKMDNITVSFFMFLFNFGTFAFWWLEIPMSLIFRVMSRHFYLRRPH